MSLMSRINIYKWTVMVLFFVILVTSMLFAQDEPDEILTYYTNRANEVFDGRNPIVSGVVFSFTVKQYYKIFNDNGSTKIIDSVESQCYYSFGRIDSVLTLTEPKNEFDTLYLDYPNVFSEEYQFNFFPNDTGGQELAIGYDSYEYSPEIPVGLATIDREYYFLKRLYQHYKANIKIERWSKAFRFLEIDGFIFPDSIWEMKSKSGIFSTEYYRVESGITNIKIQR